MKRLWGNTKGLKAGQLRRLQKLYQRRIPPYFLISAELARDIALLSHDFQRQICKIIFIQALILYMRMHTAYTPEPTRVEAIVLQGWD